MASKYRGRHHSVPKGDPHENNISAADKYLNTWITRYNDITFKCSGVYHGIVETIQSKGAATVVIGEKEKGAPLMWNDNWSDKKLKFAKVLLLVDRLRPTIDQPEYDKDTILRDKIKEGEMLFVVVEESKHTPDNIYKYFASSAFKAGGVGRVLNESILLSIRDPLRGIVDSYVSQDVGIIRFGTYNGLISKALFTSSSYKSASKNVAKSLKDVAPVHTMVYIEVTKWIGKTKTQEWEKLLHRDGILFKATLVWPKDTSRPNRRGGEEGKGSENDRFVHGKKELRGSDGDLPSRFGANVNPKTNYDLTDIHAYCGVIEIILSSAVALVCTAHRKGEPLSWKDNWFAQGVSMERILLISDHVRVSKNAPQSAKGTPIQTLLQKGDLVMVVVEPTMRTPEKCYKWFAKTCWKVTDEVEGIPNIPLELLSGHLLGEVDSIISHDIGVICFETHHGFTAKAIFSHESYYKNGRKILPHIPLGTEIGKGTGVHLIVNKWQPRRNTKELEQVCEEEVHYRAVMVWEIGNSRPDGIGIADSKQNPKSYDNGKMHYVLGKFSPDVMSSSAIQGQSKSDNFRVPHTDKKQFADKTGGKRGKYSRAGMKSSISQQKVCDSKSTGDWVDLAENLHELSSLLGATSLSTENLSTASSNQSESKYSSRREMPQRERVNKEEKINLKVSPNRPKNVESPSSDTKSGTLVSIDESWGLLQLNGNDVHDFQSNVVYMYGLKLEDVPLHKLFHPGQKFRVHMDGGEIIAVEYGSPQLPNLIRKAITVYCDNSSISEDVRHKLECIMKTYGV